LFEILALWCLDDVKTSFFFLSVRLSDRVSLLQLFSEIYIYSGFLDCREKNSILTIFLIELNFGSCCMEYLSCISTNNRENK
jgi:uncharacterized membrane protein